MRRQATTTSGLYHIGAGKLAGAPVPMPPPDIQRRVINLLRDELQEASEIGKRAAGLRIAAEALLSMRLLATPESLMPAGN